MTVERIEPPYREKTAYVYLRQSSPGQVKKNVEGGRRQRRMQERVQELGWPAGRICLLGGDTGQSGESQHGREDYQVILEGVLNGQAGAVAARELSRLARDDQDWNQLLRICRYRNVLLIDEHRVYDATDPQDRVMLGIAGAFSDFELSVIVDRMQQCRLDKAERGELYDRLATGYICRLEPHLEKHPDDRVQRAVAKVFDHFDRCASVLQLHDQLLEEGFELPIVPQGRDWRDVEWLTPSYDQLLYMLKHPVYAGIYVRGRKQTFAELDGQGHVQKHRRCVPRDQWAVFLEGHHEPYISRARWEQNVEKIASNTRGAGMPRSPQESPSLLVGLLRCQRCGSKLHATYPHGAIRYSCRGGSRQRQRPRQQCFSFTATHVEERIAEMVLEVVRPAGIAAACEATERLARQQQERRQLIVDRWEACREAAARAERDYKATDATYSSVRRHLAAEWETALAAVETEAARLAAFDAPSRTLPTAEQRRLLDRLGQDVNRLWHHPRASMALKKQIVRTLVEEILVDPEADRDELIFCIHWTGGHHTQLRLPRRSRSAPGRALDLKATIGTLRKVLRDGAIAAVLNREGIRPDADATWTAERVTSFRREHGIAGFSKNAKEKHGWLTQAEAANCLSVSAMSVTRLVQDGILPAEQPAARLPAVILRDALSLPQVKRAVTALKNSHNRPLTHDPNQLSLFPTTNS
jgi:DNA invertase Pin-like site-specific DNA recombinase